MAFSLKELFPEKFTVPVSIHIPGRGAVDIDFTFKHRSVQELEKLLKSKMKDVEYVLAICTGWELDEEFTKQNVATLLNTYHGAAAAIARTYVSELVGPAADQKTAPKSDLQKMREVVQKYSSAG